MKILIIDNYDSFTYNIVHLVKQLGYSDVEVHRNDKISLEEVGRFDKIILSPGPGVPSEAGILLDVIKKYAPAKSILGVCLGEQAIGEAFGAQLINLPDVYHGVSSEISIVADDYIFDGLGGDGRNATHCVSTEITVGRYHSWAVSDENLPDCLEITAVDENGMIMALRHREYDVRGVQFHPESVLTPKGEEMIKKWLSESEFAG
ncbi:MAG: aminodeoxychorismate/anthranilate synthase component II [Prevotellaceae bacterium]|jgi:anthranilate synthase component 2|nr:aminodeoxychorismate/anthranilate synthase component II [Prevotellaceae bacterium]